MPFQRDGECLTIACGIIRIQRVELIEENIGEYVVPKRFARAAAKAVHVHAFVRIEETLAHLHPVLTAITPHVQSDKRAADDCRQDS